MGVILTCPLHDVQAVMALRRPSHIVSLMSPDAALDIGPDDTGAAHLVLRFHDIDAPRDGLVAPDTEHVRSYLDFLHDWDGTRPLLVHCWAGVSRSPAAAYIAACVHGGVGCEPDMARALRASAPYATPNRHLVALADDLLARSGAMVSAVKAIGRGSDTAWGSSFSLPCRPRPGFGR